MTLLAFAPVPAGAQTSGSISGTVTDPTGNVIPDIAVIATDTDTNVKQTAVTNGTGFYAFPTLPVGHYDIETFRPGFKPYKRTGLVIDINTRLQIDISLEIGQQSEEMTVSANALQVETESTQVGDVVSADVITAVPLNGRAFTDLLSLQPGVVPMSTQTPTSIVMAGAGTAIAPSGALNPGNQSISGQREDENGFLVNGGDVKELMNGGTLIVPDLDSLSEFRILTNNFDAEYGNYTGGIVNVATKSGTNDLHGTAFEFLRNTALDARNFFSPTVETYDQNQFGGSIGGPIKKNKIFFFGDYQGTRTTEGIDTGQITVPGVAARSGNLFGLLDMPVQNPEPQVAQNDLAALLNGTVPACNVSATCLATQLSNGLSAALGHSVSVAPGEAYYTPNCTSYSQCVFPNGIFPMAAWSAPAQHLLQYIPAPNIGLTTFETGADNETIRDDKGSARIDASSDRWGQLFAYYFYDNYYVNNPYPTSQGGASVPGFNGINTGNGQLVTLGQVKTFGPDTVNEVHLSYMRSYNNIGQPQGGVGPSLSSQGFLTGEGTQGIYPLDPAIEGIENVVFSGQFILGVPVTNLAQANNTWTASDNFSRIIGKHTIKTGYELILNQVGVNANNTFNGTYIFTGGAAVGSTGSDFADFLIGAPNTYTQSDSEAYYPRHAYMGGFGQDSWLVRPNLTLNYGLRWDLMEYWSEKYNQVPTFIPGEESLVYPTAFPGLVHPGDPGVPNTLVPSRSEFSPRVGLAYSPGMTEGIWSKIFGGPGKTSIRTGYGIFYAVIQGNILAFDEPQPPFGLSYSSGTPPLFATPFTAQTGEPGTNPYPIAFPPFGSTASNPNPNLNFSPYIPLQGMTAPPPTNTYPYTENYFLSLERQLSPNTVLDLSYIGTQAHHLIVVYSANPGIPSLCLALQTQGCGPGLETQYGTRVGLGPDYGNDDYAASIGNSNYNAMEVTLQRRARDLTFMLSYTYSKSIDQASSMAEPVDPLDFSRTRAPSAFDLRHNFVATYDYTLPIEKLLKKSNRFTQGWDLTGTTRISSGFPVTLYDDGDNSLEGSTPNGVNNHSLDLPDCLGLPLDLNSRNVDAYFNVNAFEQNALGTPGSCSRRFFYGPGMLNTDITLRKTIHIHEASALELRAEAFNVFNTTQFFGPATVDGDISNTQLFGHIVQAYSPRLMQLGVKYSF